MKKILTDDEVNIIKHAKKILKKLTNKHNKLANLAWDTDDCFKLDEFEESLYKQAKIDFIDTAFIKI